MLAALAAFGVGVDLIHEMLPRGRWYDVVGIVEDGGEMVVMSFIVALVFASAARAEHPS
jgi:uncharacterized protein with GYD domain